jgi:uracil-DNA glycosylase
MCPDDHKPSARVRVVAQNPGESEINGRRFVRWYKGEEGTGEVWEAANPSPLIGKTGWELDHQFLPLANLKRDEVECCNVVRCRLDNSNDLPPLTTKMAREMVTHCQRAYWKEPRGGQTLVALGAYALWALTQEYEGDDEDADSSDDDLRASKSIDGWRGWLLPYLPQHVERTVNVQVFATYHPSFYYRAHWLKPVGKMDFARLGRVLKGTWPEEFPTIQQDIPSTRQGIMSFDTEYNPWTKELHRYSVAWRGADDSPTIKVIEARDMIMPCPQSFILVMQNAEADWPYINSVMGEIPLHWEDTMLAHSLLYGTLRHSLDFMGSCYARHNRWKHLQQSDPLTYSGMDALATYDIWHQLRRELERDLLSKDLYENELKPLLPHVMARPHVRLNAMHIANAAQALKKEQEEIESRGQVAAGWPLSVSSPDQVSRWLRLKSDPQ